MGNAASKYKAKKAEKQRRKEIDGAISRLSRRKILLLIGNKGCGKKTIIKSLMKVGIGRPRKKIWTDFDIGAPEIDEILMSSIAFSYNLKRFVINEFSESLNNSSRLKHLNAVMSILEQKRRNVEDDDLNYEEPIEISMTLPLISAFYNSIMREDNDNKHEQHAFPEDICQIIIAFADREPVFSYSYELKYYLFETWNSDSFGQRSLSPLFVFASAIIFVVDISGYDEYILDEVTGKRENKLCRDFNLFCDCVPMWAQNIVESNEDGHLSSQVILFLNKEDLFKEKLKSVPLNRCELFSDFVDDANENVNDGDEEHWAAVKKIQEVFVNEFEKNTKRHQLFVHVLSAIENDIVPKIFWSIHDIVVPSSLHLSS